MNRYVVVSSTDIDVFIKAVENHLEHGFTLTGGLSVMWEDEKIIGTKAKRYYQALTKRRVFKIGKEDKKMRSEDQTGI